MTWMTFIGPTYTLDIPGDWLIMSSPEFQVMFLGPIEAGDTVRPNLLLAIQRLEAGSTAQEVAASALEAQQQDYPEFQVLDENDFSEGELTGALRTYTWHNPDQGVYLHQSQAMYVLGQSLYTLTATRGADDPKADRLDETMQVIMGSFTAREVPFEELG